jgi:alkylhydroperoxidase family enzyme
MLLKTFGSGEVSPEIEKVYKSFIDTVGMVPPPFLMYSTSPGIQALQADIINYYREKSNLSPLLMALIRYLTAVGFEMSPCVDFNARALKAHGMSDEEIEDLKMNPASAPLDEKDGWLLAFVIKAVRAPETASEGHAQKLRDLGWTDADIFDALHIACMMVGMERMMRALRFEVPFEGTTDRQSD